MLIGLAVLKSTDWSRLLHAYGRATDTPGHLLALLSEETGSRKKAISHLWSAIIHQGTPYIATEPAALVVAGLLSDERIDHGEPIRADLLSFLVSVAQASEQSGLSREELEQMSSFDIEPFLDAEDDDALYENEDAASSLYARSILGCMRATPILMQVMLDGIDDASPRVRSFAAIGAVKLANTEALQGYAKELESRLLARARAAEDSDERSALVLALGDLGYSPLEFLRDASSAVRMCAALAPSLAKKAVAIKELLNALEYHAGEIRHWFTEKPPQFPMHPRFAVVARLVQQVKDFDRLENAAIAVVGITTKLSVDFDWGPLLAAAFPDGTGAIESESQRRFLTALIEKSELWDTSYGNAYKWFKMAGLPYDRKTCAKFIS